MDFPTHKQGKFTTGYALIGWYMLIEPIKHPCTDMHRHGFWDLFDFDLQPTI